MTKFKSLSAMTLLAAGVSCAALALTLTLHANGRLRCNQDAKGSCLEAELNTDVTREKAGSDEVFGIADMHAHPFANEAFGGLFFQGKSFDREGLAKALTSCDHTHGSFGLGDLIGNAVNGRVGHNTKAYPSFEGWPAWNAINHQQIYYKWLERAHRGGLRLMVAHAVNSEALCSLMTKKEGYTCNDMEAVDRQIKAAYDLEAFIDEEEGGEGWLKVVRSPEEARAAIKAGKLAMVLGIEVDSLFNCGVKNCDPETLLQKLDAYHEKGVRHIIPIHVTDNAFGGAAMYNPFLFNYANRLQNGSFFQAEDCSYAGYTYRETEEASASNILGTIFPQYPKLKAFCNVRSLTNAGSRLIAGMMDRGMIIDIDHMSANTANAVINIAENHDYPLASGHTGFVESSAFGQKRSEAQKTETQLRRLLRLEGVVAPILQQGNALTEVVGGDVVKNDCDRSSKSFAQAYLYALKVAREESAYPAVGLGSDFNGIIEMPAPRFGRDGCAKNKLQTAFQENPVSYPFHSPWVKGSFDRQISGEKRFDYNFDGFSQVGLLPDFIQELSQIGISNDDIAPMFRSAEAYIRMWEKAEARSREITAH